MSAERYPPSLPKTPKEKLTTGIAMVSSTGFLLLAAVIFVPAFIWFGCRIEPGNDELAVLIRKTGRNLPSGEIIATEKGQKGIQIDVLSEGRYFRNPYTWGWKIHKITDIPSGDLGICARLYGDNLPLNEIIAREGTKGILPDVLKPGKHRINPYAFHIKIEKAFSIPPGHVGIVTSLTGKDVFSGGLEEKHKNTFLVEDGQKGVLPKVLDPGTYYLNPYIYNVVEVNLQSQRFEMSGKDVISFLTLDGFTVTVEGTIEFAVQREDAAQLTHRVGDMNDIIQKIIMPRARGFSRIEGSKHPAIDFIVGQTRQKFQKDLDTHLRGKCEAWGVDMKSVLVRKITVPDQIASISRDREIAVQDANKFEQQIAQARSEAELVKQEMLAQQNKEVVQAETLRIQGVISAQQEQQVRLIAAKKDLEVARVNLDAAEAQAQAVRLKANGERDAVKARNEAEAAVVEAQVKAFGEGMGFARYAFYQAVGPRIKSVLSSDDKGLGGLFAPFLAAGKEGSR